MGLWWWPFSGLSWAFPWPLRWGGGLARLALSVASCGPFRAFLAVGWLLVGSCGGWWRWVSGGLWWPFSGLSFGLCGVRLVWPVWASPGLSSAFSGPFLRLFWGWLLVSLWGVLPWSSLGSCWCPVRSPGLVLLGSGSKVVERRLPTLSSCRWYGLCRGGARRVEEGRGKGSIPFTHILPL